MKLGLPSIVFCLLLTLKLLNLAEITWFWVFAPLWIGACVWVGLLIVLGIIGVIGALLHD